MGLPQGTTHVDPPAFVPSRVGIFSVVTPESVTGPKLLGTVYESDGCLPSHYVAEDPDSCVATAEKEFDEGSDWVYSTRFPIYRGYTCKGADPGAAEAIAQRRLEHSEELLVERKLWEGIFPDVAVDLTPVGGAVGIVRGVGILLSEFRRRSGAKPIIHMGSEPSIMLLNEGIDNEEAGFDLVIGSGYYSLNGPLLSVPALASPVITKGAVANTGDFAAGTYFWKLTAINAHGETLGSNEVTATLIADDQQIINWSAITGATGYILYRGIAAGAEDTLVATLGAVVTYTDTGDSESFPAELPVQNTTGYEAPVVAAADEAWVYVTGPVVLGRDEIRTESAFQTALNDGTALAERTYIGSVECYVAAIRVTLED